MSDHTQKESPDLFPFIFMIDINGLDCDTFLTRRERERERERERGKRESSLSLKLG